MFIAYVDREASYQLLQMVTIEVNLKEGDEEPEQHLDEGEHIERRVVPLDKLYDTLQGMYVFSSFRSGASQHVLQPSPRKRISLWTRGKS